MISVLGATGNTGAAVCRALLMRGVPFRAISRDPAAARARLGVDAVQADVEDRDSLAAALRGSERVYLAMGGAPRLEEVERSIIDVAEEVGVRQLVKLSGVEVEPAHAIVQRIHGAVEARLRESRLDWTVLGGNFFYQNFLGFVGPVQAGVLPLPTGDGRAAMVDAADIGRVAAAVLTGGDHAGRRYRLTGPEALRHADVAERLSVVLGRAVVHVDVPADAFTAAGVGAGMPPWFATWLTDIYTRFFGTPGAVAVSDDVERLTGVPPRPVEAFFTDVRGAFTG